MLERSKANESTNHVSEVHWDHTVGAPQVCSAMHDNNAINTAIILAVRHMVGREKKKSRHCVCRDVDRFRIGVCARKENCLVATPIVGKYHETELNNRMDGSRYVYLSLIGLQDT